VLPGTSSHRLIWDNAKPDQEKELGILACSVYPTLCLLLDILFNKLLYVFLAVFI
jgi:hypothetical protein